MYLHRIVQLPLSCQAPTELVQLMGFKFKSESWSLFHGSDSGSFSTAYKDGPLEVNHSLETFLITC